jgi:hypothetical protein
MKTQIFFSVLAGVLLNGAAFAGDCEITVTRTACPGQEAISYSKCPGDVQTCTEPSSAYVPGAINSNDDCANAALAACINTRFTITKYKKITAVYDGQDFDHGRDFCDHDSGTYAVSQNFPYRENSDCK